MQQIQKLDTKDLAILRELDSNFRQPFSKIAKKVGLSKNSVALRFNKLKECMLHNLVGIDNELLGYHRVEVYYNLDFYNEETEKKLILELKKHKNVLWAARFYGYYDLCICLFVSSLGDLINQIKDFNKKFSSKINRKEIQIIHKQFHFRHNFIHEKPIKQIYEVPKDERKIDLSTIEKKILFTIRHAPRMSLIEIARKTRLTPKTVSSRLKELEQKGVITGYFMTINPAKFNHDLYKLLIQLNNSERDKEFEEYLKSIKNIRLIAKMLGLWDYQVDCAYPNINYLQEQIEIMKQKFPNLIKKIGIVSLGYRILTNKEDFLI